MKERRKKTVEELQEEIARLKAKTEIARLKRGLRKEIKKWR